MLKVYFNLIPVCRILTCFIRMSIGIEIKDLFVTIYFVVHFSSNLTQTLDFSNYYHDLISQFYMESTWAMQVSYYNISRAVWEPLIEPVEILKDYTYKHVPWELKMEVRS